jgi:hypothetical protein
MKKTIVDYLIGCGDALSQLVNKCLFNGHPNESLSGRSHREGLAAEKWIDALFFLQDNHCKTSHENDVVWAEEFSKKAKRND